MNSRNILSDILQSISKWINLSSKIYGRICKKLRKCKPILESSSCHHTFWESFTKIIAESCPIYQVELKCYLFRVPFFGSVFSKEKLKITILKNDEIEILIEKNASLDADEISSQSSSSDSVSDDEDHEEKQNRSIQKKFKRVESVAKSLIQSPTHEDITPPTPIIDHSNSYNHANNKQSVKRKNSPPPYPDVLPQLSSSGEDSDELPDSCDSSDDNETQMPPSKKSRSDATFPPLEIAQSDVDCIEKMINNNEDPTPSTSDDISSLLKKCESMCTQDEK